MKPEIQTSISIFYSTGRITQEKETEIHAEKGQKKSAGISGNISKQILKKESRLHRKLPSADDRSWFILFLEGIKHTKRNKSGRKI